MTLFFPPGAKMLRQGREWMPSSPSLFSFKITVYRQSLFILRRLSLKACDMDQLKRVKTAEGKLALTATVMLIGGPVRTYFSANTLIQCTVPANIHIYNEVFCSFFAIPPKYKKCTSSTQPSVCTPRHPSSKFKSKYFLLIH